jgi:predicted O-methyltransferase YrrM
VIDIGSAEGYYAVGLATRLPEARIICFEAQDEYHFLLRDLGALNKVEKRMQIHGFCTPELLNSHFGSSESTLVVCDVEGAEDQLLDPDLIPGLRNADILVELHDAGLPGISQKIRDRFEATHTITTLTSRERTPQDWPLRQRLGWKKEEQFLSEHRPAAMDWFWMEKKEQAMN